MLFKFFEVIIHVDTYLQAIVNEHALAAYVLLFAIIFLETGAVITPFLPGDSLLFAAGALAATGSFEIMPLFIIIFIAAVIGDTANYHIGKYIGPKIFKKESSILFHREHLTRAQNFYKNHGKKTIILARFIPIIRTFAPFVAGIGTMSYWVFILYNLIGAALWCGLFIFGGYLFGNIPWVKENFGLFILIIIFISLIPILKEIGAHFLARRKSKNNI